MDRKKELKEQYKLYKPEMGVFLIRNKENGWVYLEETNDLKGTMNGTIFKLKTGSHKNKGLQKDWTVMGEGGFEVEIIDRLDYDKDETKTTKNYLQELEIMKEINKDRLKEKCNFY